MVEATAEVDFRLEGTAAIWTYPFDLLTSTMVCRVSGLSALQAVPDKVPIHNVSFDKTHKPQKGVALKGLCGLDDASGGLRRQVEFKCWVVLKHGALHQEHLIPDYDRSLKTCQEVF